MATVVWTGGAQDVAQIVTLTFGGTWAASETCNVTCNDKTVTVTGGSTLDTPEEYAAALQEALASMTADATTFTADMTINQGGRQIPEMYDFTATVSGAVVTLTGEPGVPFTVSSGETSASGSLVQATPTACTGKHFFDNSDNWSATPGAGDMLRFESGQIDVLYALNNATLDYDLYISTDYTGSIGLPYTNPGRGGGSYPEYRDRFLEVPVTAATTASHDIGAAGDSQAIGRRYLDFGTNAATAVEVNVHAAQGPTGDGAAVQIRGGQNVDLVVRGGSVEAGMSEGANLTNFQYLRLLEGSTSIAPDVHLGTVATFDNVLDSIRQYAGNLVIECPNDGGSNKLDIHGGRCLVAPDATQNDINVYAGYCDFRASSADTVQVYGGEFDASRCESCTVTNDIELYSGSTYRDPQNVLNKPVHLNGCRLDELTLDLRANLQLTPGTI